MQSIFMVGYDSVAKKNDALGLEKHYTQSVNLGPVRQRHMLSHTLFLASIFSLVFLLRIWLGAKKSVNRKV